MLPLLLVSLLVTGGFEAGARVGVVFPSSGLENTHGAAATFGAGIGYEAGPNRIMLGYGYFGLPARQASPYQFNVHEVTLGYGREFVLGSSGMNSNWGFEASAAAGLGLLNRSVGPDHETGRAPSAIIGLGFYQRQGHSRLDFGLDNFLFREAQPVGNASTVSLTYLIALKGGVTYVF
jgi:hypothetical protein